MSSFVTIQGSPCWPRLAPYIAIIVDDAHASVESIYRGNDAAFILNRHEKHSQAQLSAAWIAYRDHGQFLYGFSRSNPPNPANPPGHSTHEGYSDGQAYPSVPSGHKLQWWQLGFDVDDQYVNAVIAQAASHKWHVFRPYKTGSEYHHLNFAAPPRPTPMTALRIVRLRATLPRS